MTIEVPERVAAYMREKDLHLTNLAEVRTLAQAKELIADADNVIVAALDAMLGAQALCENINTTLLMLIALRQQNKAEELLEILQAVGENMRRTVN